MDFMESQRRQKERRQIQTAVLAALSVMVLMFAAAMGYLYYQRAQQEQQYAEMVAALQEEAKPYERELIALTRLVDKGESVLEYVPDHTMVAVGFIPDTAFDMDYVEEYAFLCDHNPVIALDCAKEVEVIWDILMQSMDRDYDLIMMSSRFDSGVLRNIREIKGMLEEYGLDTDLPFLLRKSDDDQDNMDILLQEGFHVFSRYSDHMVAGLTREMNPYTSYSIMRSADACKQTVSNVTDKRTAALLLYDLKNVGTESMSTESIEDNLNRLGELARKGELEWTTLGKLNEAVSDGVSMNLEGMENYDAYIAVKQARVRELEEKLREINSKLAAF